MLSNAAPPGTRPTFAVCELREAHHFGLPEARKRGEALVRRLQNELGARWSSDGSRFKFTFPTGGMKGLSGTIAVTTDAVEVDLRLTPTLHITRLAVESKLRGMVHEAFT